MPILWDGSVRRIEEETRRVTRRRRGTASRGEAEQAMRKTISRVRDNRWRNWTGWLTSHRTSPVPLTERPVAQSPELPTTLLAVAPGEHELAPDDLKKQITTAVFAFRGYDVTNY